MNISLFGLKIFVMVSEKKSFSEAARSLYVTQPAITHQVKRLENHFATPSFKRQSNTVLLTLAGEILYTYAKRFFQLGNGLREEIERSTGRLTGNLVIGACTICGVCKGTGRGGHGRVFTTGLIRCFYKFIKIFHLIFHLTP